MKKIFFLSMAALVLAITGCSKDDDDNKNNTGNSEITIAGEKVTIEEGAMYYFGPYGNDTPVNIDLELLSADNSGLYLELYAPSGSMKLVAGTYTYDESDDDLDFIISEGEVAIGYNEIEDSAEYADYVTAGTVKIAVNGTTYTITLNLTLSDGEKVTGTYTGTLKLFDESDE